MTGSHEEGKTSHRSGQDSRQSCSEYSAYWTLLRGKKSFPHQLPGIETWAWDEAQQAEINAVVVLRDMQVRWKKIKNAVFWLGKDHLPLWDLFLFIPVYIAFSFSPSHYSTYQAPSLSLLYPSHSSTSCPTQNFICSCLLFSVQTYSAHPKLVDTPIYLMSYFYRSFAHIYSPICYLLLLLVGLPTSYVKHKEQQESLALLMHQPI